jgi:hypothetical protein
MKKLMCLPLVLIAACAIAPEAPTVPPPAPPPPPKQDATATGWLRSLDGKPAATFEDGLRAAAMLVDRELVTQPWTTLKGRLMGRGLVPEDWNYLPASMLSKGQMAYFLVEALELHGGVMLNILSNTRRYAFRECQHRGFIVGDFDDEVLSGNDLLAVLFKADLYQREGTLDSIRRP